MDPISEAAVTRAQEWASAGIAAELRAAAGLSLRDVALACGVRSPATPLRWERGIRRPTGAAGARYGALLLDLVRGGR